MDIIMIKNKKFKAFSMMEILIVLSIIGILLLIAIPKMQKGREVAMEIACKAELDGLKSSLELYYTRYGSYPSGLNVLIEEHFTSLDGATDPWARPYVYTPFKSMDKVTRYKLFSPGVDGIIGSEDDISR